MTKPIDLLGGYPSTDALARAGSYLDRAPAHVDREHLRDDTGTLYTLSPSGGRIVCRDAECERRAADHAYIAAEEIDR